MKTPLYITCQFCNKRFNKNDFVELLTKNECCKECFSKGFRENPKFIGIEIIETLKKGKRKWTN